MCEKCKPQDTDLLYRALQKTQKETIIQLFELEVDKENCLDIVLWKNAEDIGLRARSPINYCPWCGRKLSEVI